MDTVRASANGVFGYLTPVLRARRYLVSYGVVFLSAQLVVETVEESVRGECELGILVPNTCSTCAKVFLSLGGGGGCATPDEYVTVFFFSLVCPARCGDRWSIHVMLHHQSPVVNAL